MTLGFFEVRLECLAQLWIRSGFGQLRQRRRQLFLRVL